MKQARMILWVAALVLASCRGTESAKPPIHLNRNMDHQQRFDPHEANAFFVDGRSMRPPVPGTVARGLLRDDVRFHEGRNPDGSFVTEMPVPLTMELLERGRERYDIFCAPCHGGAGDGQGLITTGGYGYTPAPTVHSDRLREMADGYLYDVIANGMNTMPSYAHQIPTADRWAIVSYVRALQRSQHADASDVPTDVRQDADGG